jgi:hypothetical protein
MAACLAVAYRHGFARSRCDDGAREFFLAFSCTCRDCCPSGHAKRVTIWTQWLDTTPLAPVPHRQIVLTIPRRLRAYCPYRRRLLGEIARVAARTVTAAIRTRTGERDLAVGIVACLQTHGALDRGVPPRRTPALRAPRTPQRGPSRRHPDVAALGVPCPYGRLGVGRRSRLRHPARAVLRAESRRARTAHLRPQREGGDVPVRLVGGPDGRHRDGRPARVPGSGAGVHPGQGACHDTVQWLVCEPPAGHAVKGGAGNGGRAARHRPCRIRRVVGPRGSSRSSARRR